MDKNNELLVKVSEGHLLGTTKSNINGEEFFCYQGVPYAKPPLGNLRFKAPQPPEKWKGIREAKQDGSACYAKNFNEYSGSEDCLYLNVFTKDISGKERKPVMVWIHGGAFTKGSNSTTIYGPEYLMTEDIVLVTINYRLGPLGFLVLGNPSLGVPGNAGLKDIVMSLKWVQKNIEYFLGDPNNVTIFGESAGGAAVHLLMFSPMSKGELEENQLSLNCKSDGNKENRRDTTSQQANYNLDHPEVMIVLQISNEGNKMVDKEENQALSEDLDGDQLITKTLMAEKETIDIIIEHENEKEQILDPDYEMDENEINSSDDETEINEATNLAQEVEEEPEQQKNLEEQTETNKKRNRNALKEKWDKNVIKKLRMQGTEYKGYERTRDGVVKKGIARPARRMSMKCLSEACKKMKNRHCYKFSEEERTSIFTSFWQNTNWDEKRVYATSNIEYISKKRSSTGENSRRSGTFNYFLRKADNTKFQVCKKMFLGTMGLKEDMVQDWVKKTNQNHGINAPLTARKESQNRNNQKRNELIKFFDSLPKMPSHYCRKESSKLYLEQFFQTKQELYKLYKKYCEENSFPELVLSTPVFDQVFSDMNLALYQPRKDRCDTCCGYETKNISEEEYQEHLRKKERARQEKNKDKELAKQGKVYTLCMDMQAVKICPMINASAIYYKTKLSVHNFTIYDMDSHVCKNYWFNETEGDLSASTFANFVIDFIKDKCTKKIPIILYSDGCSYQNKNVVLSNALLNYSIKNKIVIEQKYLQKGHTQMECDAVHSLIERKLKGRVIELPSDYIKATQEARNKPLPLEAVYITHDFFLDYGDQNTWVYNSIRPGKKANDPTVSNLKHLKYNFYSQKIEYKIDFDHELQLLPARSLKYPDIVQYKALHNSRLKIKQTKWKHLQEIKSVLSKDCHDFYDNLPF